MEQQHGRDEGQALAVANFFVIDSIGLGVRAKSGLDKYTTESNDCGVQSRQTAPRSPTHRVHPKQLLLAFAVLFPVLFVRGEGALKIPENDRLGRRVLAQEVLVGLLKLG